MRGMSTESETVENGELRTNELIFAPERKRCFLPFEYASKEIKASPLWLTCSNELSNSGRIRS